MSQLARLTPHGLLNSQGKARGITMKRSGRRQGTGRAVDLGQFARKQTRSTSRRTILSPNLRIVLRRSPGAPCRGFYLGSLRDRRRPATADQRKEGRNMGKPDGKVAIVTRATRGLRRASAKRLAGLGAKIAVADLNLHSYEEFEAE